MHKSKLSEIDLFEENNLKRLIEVYTNPPKNPHCNAAMGITFFCSLKSGMNGRSALPVKTEFMSGMLI